MRMTYQAPDNLIKILADFGNSIQVQQVHAPKNSITLQSSDPLVLKTIKKFFTLMCLNSKIICEEDSGKFTVTAEASDDLGVLLNEVSAEKLTIHQKLLSELYAQRLYQSICQKYKSNYSELATDFSTLSLAELIVFGKLLGDANDHTDLLTLKQQFLAHFEERRAAADIKKSCETYFSELTQQNLLRIHLEEDLKLRFHMHHPLIQDALDTLFRKEEIPYDKKGSSLIEVPIMNPQLLSFLDKEKTLAPAQTHHAILQHIIALVKKMISEKIHKPQQEDDSLTIQQAETLLETLNSRKPKDQNPTSQASPNTTRRLRALYITLEDCIKAHERLSEICNAQLEQIERKKQFRRTLFNAIRTSKLFKKLEEQESTPHASSTPVN